MVKIYANGQLIYQPLDEDLVLLNPKLSLEMGKAGSLDFSIPPTNPHCNDLTPFQSFVSVKMDGTEVFYGRVLTNDCGFDGMRKVYCEGDLAFLVDSVQKTERFEGRAHDFFRQIVANHNSRVDEYKQFTVGQITVENRDILITGTSDEIEDADTGEFNYDQIAINAESGDWPNTLDYIESCLIDYLGGYLRTRRENGVTYIDYLEDYGITAEQEITFGENLLDFTDETNVDDLFTVLIPLGDEGLTIADANDGSDELVNEEAVEKYNGRIIKTHKFDGVSDPQTLMENGLRFMETNMDFRPTITVKAIDMHWVNPWSSPIQIGAKVKLNFAQQGFDDYLTCTKIDHDLSDPTNSDYTFGVPKPTLTERYRKDKQKKSGGGKGKAAETAAEEAAEQLEKYDSWVRHDPEAGTVDIGGLYQKVENLIELLYSDYGINGRVGQYYAKLDITTMHRDLDETKKRSIKSATAINNISNDLKAQIDLTAAFAEQNKGEEQAHYAELTVRADATESAIEGKADIVDFEAVRIHLHTVSEQVDANTLNISRSSTQIEQLSDAYSAQVTINAKFDSDISDAQANIAEIKLTADEQGSKIELLADDVDVLDGDITVMKGTITALNGRFDNLMAGHETASHIVTNAFTTSSMMFGMTALGLKTVTMNYIGSTQFVTLAANSTVSPVNLNHSHAVEFSINNTTGEVIATIGSAQAADGTDSFNIADTEFYQTAASAGYTEGLNAVTIVKGDWDYGYIAFTKSAGTPSTKSLQIATEKATWSGNIATVQLRDSVAGVRIGFPVQIDASERYSDGQESVTLGSPTWATTDTTYYNVYSVLASNGNEQAQALYLTSGSWSNGTQRVYLRTDSTGGTARAHLDVSMPSSGTWVWSNPAAGYAKAQITVGGRIYSDSHKIPSGWGPFSS